MKSLAVRSALSNQEISETETQQFSVCAKRTSARDRNTPQIAQLSTRNISRIGITWTNEPLERHRSGSNGTVFIAALEGLGLVQAHGEEKEICQGKACLLPRDSEDTLEIGGNERWAYVFVCYDEPEGVAPVATSNKVQLDEFDSMPLVHAIRGLHTEATGSPTASSLHFWVELIHGYVLKFANPRVEDDRVWQAWERVKSALDQNWTLKEIAGQASMSAEHFRRLCQESIGISPMKHLHQLRMQRAADLLASTNLKIEAVALEIGYVFASTFSNTFQKWSGLRPSEYRQAAFAGRTTGC